MKDKIMFADDDNNDKDLTYEEALNSLKLIVSKLERGDIHLEETAILYEQGQKMLKICRQQLDKAKGKLYEVSEHGKKEID